MFAEKTKKSMDQERFEHQRAFAGEKKPSMLRRKVGHDYHGRQVYMVTLVTEGRRKLFGEVVGRSNGTAATADEPRIELSPFGKLVEQEFLGIPRYHPQVEVMAVQMMPDHLHGVLFVHERMEATLGDVIRGFKTGCNRHFRECGLLAAEPQQTRTAGRQEGQPQQTRTAGRLEEQAQQTGTTGRQKAEPLQTRTEGRQEAQAQQTRTAGRQEEQAQQTRTGELPQPMRRDRHGEHQKAGMVFQHGYNDKLLRERGQLERWRQYLNDNPRRLLMKREHPDLFRVQRNVEVAGMAFSALGNRFLLDVPDKLQVRCSRSLTDDEVAEQVKICLEAARRGCVLVSPAISKGEKMVMRAAFEAGHPLIVLQENGLTDLAKPGGQRMQACSEGRLLLLAPWEHHNERMTITRGQCQSLNEMVRRICEE